MQISNVKSLELTDMMAKLGAKCLIHCLQNFPKVMSEAKVQPSEGVTTGKC